MKRIYIILTYTGTMLSRAIKYYTRDEFSHVSIALDRDLNHMYSFGRLNPYNPFYGGFVHEKINKGTYKRFSKTKCRVYSFEISDEQYQKLEFNIDNIKKLRRYYKFNLLGLFAVAFKRRIGAENSFYCAEFVKYVIENAGIKTNLPTIVKPEDFKKIENLSVEYEGLLRDYKSKKLVEISK